MQCHDIDHSSKTPGKQQQQQQNASLHALRTKPNRKPKPIEMEEETTFEILNGSKETYLKGNEQYLVRPSSPQTTAN
jgi:hypothetical protein